MKKKRFRAAAAQTLARLGDIEHNIELATQLVDDALRQGAELVVLPECMDTGYLFNSAEHCRALAETVPDGRFVSAMAALARKHGIFIASGITEWDPCPRRIFNSGIMLDRKGEVAIHYHKQFLATHDQNWFAFGERGCPVVDTDLGTHRAADLLRRAHPGNRPQPRAARRRDHRRHGELLRHGPGRHVGAGALLRERRAGWWPRPRPATSARSITPAAA